MKGKSLNIGNRILAIKKAILNADPGEVVLIAGKGHEDKQIYKGNIETVHSETVVVWLVRPANLANLRNIPRFPTLYFYL